MFWKRPFTISHRLLLAVNIPLGLALVLLLSLEFRREMSATVNEARIALREEAIAIHQALSHLKGHSTTEVQAFIRDVSREMQASHATDHHIHIQVQKEASSIQADTFEPVDSQTAGVEAMTAAFRAGQSTITLNRTLYVIGGVESRGIAVIVSENGHKLQAIVQQDLILQLGSLALLGVIAAVIVNVVVYRVVTGPLKHMTHAVDVIARGQYGGQVEPSRTRELTELATSVNLMSLALDDVDRQHRLEMNNAREIQEHLLPLSSAIPGLKVLHEYTPADDVGGDYYDFVSLPQDQWLIVIADVTGHGVPSAMAAALLKALLLCAADHSDSVLEILSQVNRRFSELLPSGRFATALLGIWHPLTRKLTYVNAGHPPGLIWNPATGVRELESTSMPIGISNQTSFSMSEVILTPGDQMVWYTDGLIEAMSPQGALFGTKRLIDLLKSSNEMTAEQLKAEVIQSVQAFADTQPFADDITLLVMQAT